MDRNTKAAFAAMEQREEAERQRGLAGSEMPRYQSHKQLWALKIKEIYFDCDRRGPGEESDGSAIIVPEEQGYASFRVDAAYVKKHAPKVGGYYVVYKGGYASWSPADAFEEGNTRVHASFKDRVIAEKNELDDKIRKLVAFVGGTIYASLPDEERSRLSIQLQHMNGYSEILGQRIAAF